MADDEAVVHDGFVVRRYDGLEPDHIYELDGFTFRTLARPPGEHLCTFTTVNDVHFGEVECGIIEGLDIGPTFAVADGDEPYPVTMNRGAIDEMLAIDPAAVARQGRPHLQRHPRGVPGLPRCLRGVRRSAVPRPRQPRRLLRRHLRRPTPRSQSICPGFAWR